MSAVKLYCPQCRKEGRIGEEFLGRKVRCNSCGAVFLVTEHGPAPAPPGKSPPGKKTGEFPPSDGPVRKIGRYEIRRELGAGTYGTVYRAYDPLLRRPVALKVPHPHVLAAGDALERFRREAEVVAQLRHPLIVPIYDAGLNKPPYYIASAFIEGITLDKVLAESPIDLAPGVEIITKLAEALAYAHARKIIHRDVKPANVILDAQGNPQLTDFGLAYRPQSAAKLTQSGMGLGTPAYMAPEQMRGDPGAAGDQWSLGVMLYEIMCGRRPFDGSVEHVIVQVFQQDPPTPRSIRPEIPAELEAICLKTLRKDSSQRYPDCGALAEDLRRFLGGQPTAAIPEGSGGRPGLLRRLLGAIGGWFSGNGGAAAPAAESESEDAPKKPAKRRKKRPVKRRRA
jgi:serine/threonine protein kinase